MGGDMRRGRAGDPRRPARMAAALSAALLALALGGCDGLPGNDPSGAATSPATAAPIDAEAVASAKSTAVDPAWLCRPGEQDSPVRSTEPGILSPAAVSAEGNELTVTGAFHLEEGFSYQGFVPEGLLLPADPENRGAPARGFDSELGVDGAPAPPMVVRQRVEIAGEGPAPSAATARLTVGTCDDSPLPDGQYLLRLSGGGVDGPGRGTDDAGWAASEDVLVDVVGGALRAVPGAVSAPTGEVPVDLSALACRAPLAAVGSGDGVQVSVADPSTRVSTVVPEDAPGAGITGQVTVTSQDPGTRALLQGIVVTNPESGTIVAGARNSPVAALQWIGEDGVTGAETAWTTQGGCGSDALRPGAYRAYGFAATVDGSGATQLVLTDPWDVEVTDEAPAT